MLYVFDFDGTIVDVWERYWRVFCTSAEVSPIKISCDDYRNLKLSYKFDNDILKKVESRVPLNLFLERKRKNLESINFLSYDKLLVSAPKLKEFYSTRNAIILTKRREKLAFFDQLNQLHLDGLEKNTVIIHPDSGITKCQWVRDNIHDKQICIVGDSVEDMNVGALEGVNAKFVNTGLTTWKEIYKKCPWSQQFNSLNSILEEINAVS